MLDLSWSPDRIWSLAGRPLPPKPGAQPIGGRIGSTKHDVGVTRAVRKTGGSSERTKEISNVSDAICYFAGTVAAGVFRVPRCQRVDSHSVNHRGDFFTVPPLQRS